MSRRNAHGWSPTNLGYGAAAFTRRKTYETTTYVDPVTGKVTKPTWRKITVKIASTCGLCGRQITPAKAPNRQQAYWQKGRQNLRCIGCHDAKVKREQQTS